MILWRMWALLLAVLAAGIIVAVTTPARSHGDAQWIQNGNYRAQTGEHCCGISDCGPVPVQDIRHVRGGYEVRGFFVKMADTLPSTDGQYWACTKPGGIRCFFAPLMG